MVNGNWPIPPNDRILMTWLVMVSWDSTEMVSHCLSQVPGLGVSQFVYTSAENSATLEKGEMNL